MTDPLAGLAPDERELVEADARLLHERLSAEGGLHGARVIPWEAVPEEIRDTLRRIAANPYRDDNGR